MHIPGVFLIDLSTKISLHLPVLTLFQKMDKRIGVSHSPRVRLMILMLKSQSLVRFLSEEECDRLFLELARFTAQSMKNRNTLYERASRVTIEEILTPRGAGEHLTENGVEKGEKSHMCGCLPFPGLCDPSSRDGRLCSCCDKATTGEGTPVATENVSNAFGGDSVDACAECLCLLHKGVMENCPL